MTAAAKRTEPPAGRGPASTTLLRRPRLEDRLDEAFGKRLTLVVADAGFGKSTLVTDWTRDLAAVRLTVERRDRDLATFAQRLLQALEAAVPIPADVRASLDAPGEAEQLDRADALAALVCQAIGDVAEHDLVLVIDDLHELSDPACVQLVGGIVRGAPELLHVLLVSRVEPRFSVARIRGRGEVLEVGAAELAFTSDEVAALLENSLGEEAKSFTDAALAITGGWPAALRLLVEALRRAEPADRAAALEAARRPEGPVFAYLAEEVFADEDAEVVELLRRTAVFERFTVALCRAVGVDISTAALAALVERGLLVSPEAGNGDYAVHALVREFARERWPLLPEEQTALHVAAARWFESQGDQPSALAEALAAGDPPELARLLGLHGAALVAGGEIGSVLQAAEQLSPSERDERLEQVIGEAFAVRGDWDAALACYDRAAAGRERLPPALAWRRGTIHWDRGEIEEALSEYARADLDDGDPEDVAFVLAWSAMGQWNLGQYADAHGSAADALEAAQRADSERARAAAHTALMLNAIGRDERLFEEHYARALAAAEAAGDVLQTIRIRLNHAGPAQPLAGRAEADVALRLAELSGADLYIAAALFGRALNSGLLGLTDEAIADLERAGAIFERRGSTRIGRVLINLGTLYLVRGETVLARTRTERGLELAEESQSVQDIVGACVQLARVFAYTDPARAQALIERGLELNRKLEYYLASSLLVAGWVALARGDRASAHAYGVEAQATAASHESWVVAEAFELRALASDDPGTATAQLEEAAALLKEGDNAQAKARVELELARFAGPAGRARARRAERRLQALGVGLGTTVAGPLAALPHATTAPLTVRTLGGFAVLRDGVPVALSEWRSRKARDLLKILIASRGRPVTREYVLEALWPGEPAPPLANRLNVAVSVLRSVLDPGKRFGSGHFVTGDGAVLALDLTDVELDVEDFLTGALAALAAASGEDGRDALLDAEAAYGGDFLAEDLYADWAVGLREEARAAYVAVARALAQRELAEGRHEASARYLRRIIERDRHDESAQLGLVSALAAAGQHGEARRSYSAYLRRMNEIDVEPAPYPSAPVRPAV